MGVAKIFNKWLKSSSLILLMVALQLLSAGNQLLSKVILVSGTFVFALVTYRSVIAASCVVPLALYFERNQEKKFGWQVWFWIFIAGLCGGSNLTMFYYGLRDTTSTYATNFLCTIPVFTFIFTVLAGIEKPKLNTIEGIVKCVGALICVAGTLTASLYKGFEFKIGHSHAHTHISTTLVDSHPHWTRGTLLLVGSCISYAAWYVVQVKLLKALPLMYWDAMLQNIVRAIQTTAIGLFVNRSSTAWKLGWNLQLLTIIYSGILSSLATVGFVWAISREGPTYPPMFSGVSLIFVAILDALVLGEAITMGMLLGMVLILGGLYAFLWAKRKETKRAANINRRATVRPEIQY